jgi:acyl carrier protein
MSNIKIQKTIIDYIKDLKSKDKYKKKLDSLGFINLILEVQKKFKIKLQLNELNQFKTLDDLKKILLKKCQKN